MSIVSVQCPICGHMCNTVKEITMRHHLSFPLSKERYVGKHYFCRNPSCEIAYFSNTQRYLVSQLQSSHQIRQHTVCYCFGITESMFDEYTQSQGNSAFFEELDRLAYSSKCFCRVKNPSGRGCLKIFRSMSVQ